MTDENYHALMVAVCRQAMFDYYRWRRWMKVGFPKVCDITELDYQLAVEYMKSDSFSAVMGETGDRVMKLLDEKIENNEPFKAVGFGGYDDEQI